MEARSHSSPHGSPPLPLPSHPPRPPTDSLPFDFFTDPFADPPKSEPTFYLTSNSTSAAQTSTTATATTATTTTPTATNSPPSIIPASTSAPSLSVAEFMSDSVPAYTSSRPTGASPRPPLTPTTDSPSALVAAVVSPAERRRLRMAVRRRRCPRRPASRFSPAATPPSTPTYSAARAASIAATTAPSPVSSVTSAPAPGTPPTSVVALAQGHHPLDKKSARVIRNREVALRARQAAKMKMKNLESENCSLKSRATSLETENLTLRNYVQRLMNGLPVPGLPLTSSAMPVGDGTASSTGTQDSSDVKMGMGQHSPWPMDGVHHAGQTDAAAVPQ